MNNELKKYFRKIHSQLGFFFAGVILIYAISGFAMNHLSSFDPRYEVSEKQYTAAGVYPHQPNFDRQSVKELLKPLGESDNYLKHFYPNDQTLKVFLKGGSTFVLNLSSGQVNYDGIHKRPFLAQVTFLHHNPNRWWTYFSDIFAVCLLIITLTGIFIPGKRNGLRGIRGVELAAGILIPILFLIFS